VATRCRSTRGSARTSARAWSWRWRTTTELVHLTQSRIRASIADTAWGGYQHQFAGNAARAEQTAADVDFDTDLMRLAAGGR
jgi:FMN reductase